MRGLSLTIPLTNLGKWQREPAGGFGILIRSRRSAMKRHMEQSFWSGAVDNRARNMARRVVHIVENLNRGAVENWLVRMLGRARGCGIEVDWTFYCVVGLPGELDDRARAL